MAKVETELKEEPAAPLSSAAEEQHRTFMRYAPTSHRGTTQRARESERKPVSSRLESSESDGIEASALVSEDGLMIASALPQGMEEARVAGMTATLVNLGTRGAVELNRGLVQEIVVRGDRGYAVLISAGRGALLLALTNEAPFVLERTPDCA